MLREISEEQLRHLVDRFYERVRQDAQLGPLFEFAITDWDAHKERLTDFWSAIMLRSGRYKGSPFAAHVSLTPSLSPELFERWLQIWCEVTCSTFSPAVAEQFQEKARRIAESLKSGLLQIPKQSQLAGP